MAKIKITVIRQDGHCALGQKLGDEYIFDRHLPDICPAAWDVLYSYIRVLQNGGDFPWAEKPGTSRVVCPDGKNPVEFLLERIEE
jgi:uncharacterized repeat protein (TIGR04076 family)